MKPTLAIRWVALAGLVVTAGGCGKSNSSATGPSPAGAVAPTPVAVAAPAAAKVDVCSLLSAGEVSAIMEKNLVQSPHSCDYGLDPNVKEKRLTQSQEALAGSARKAAQAGDLGALMASMSQGGSPGQAMSTGIMDQMTISLDGRRDDMTEETAKSMYAKTGAIVRGALAPEKHGLDGVIQGLDEVSGVGDWAFATNVASVNMGMGFSVRGRILECRKGPWHLSVSATVAPDPGVAPLDAKLAKVARAVLAKL